MVNMKYFLASVMVILSVSLSASNIGKIELSKLENKSDLIVLAKVVHVHSDKELDKITINISSVLKGEPENDEVIVLLQVRGGLKEFDPTTHVGDVGVFYLRRNSQYYRTTHGGSIAIFEKNNFE